MRVRMDHVFMSVRVGVRFAVGIVRPMGVLMMLVVSVPMIVFERLMGMVMRMVFGEVKPDAAAHQPGSKEETWTCRFAQKNHGHCPTYERSERKVGTGPGGTQFTKRNDEESEAHPVSHESHQPSGQQDPGRGHLRAYDQSERSIHGAGTPSFNKCDLNRIRSRDLSRQIVVQGPTQAGAGDGSGTPRRPDQGPALPGQGQGSYGDKRHPPCNAGVEVFSEYEPRQESGKDAFQVEQQRRRRRGCDSETQHEQDRADDAAKEDRHRKPWEIGPAQESFGCCSDSPSRRGQAIEGKPQSRSEIKQSRKHPRIGTRQQSLGERSAQPEEHRCAEGAEDPFVRTVDSAGVHGERAAVVPYDFRKGRSCAQASIVSRSASGYFNRTPASSLRTDSTSPRLRSPSA